ncbi:MAG: hypothetical protein A2901_06755 [Elusimicrobia bacterium RIFCSPLOWO2_01_FULL_54_10]|nr:MAG: hypothetical protein A2901_06755 [Elusimicrobia bacterium RIFCSPLOWO2_01_FULL_54_10]
MPAQILSVCVGVWMMAAPAVLGYAGAARMNDHIIGPLVIAFGTMAAWEFMRQVRWVNFALGLWLLLSAWVLREGHPAQWNGAACGAVLLLLALQKGIYRPERFSGGWASLR